MSQIKTTLDWARDYVEKGFSVIPLKENDVIPLEEFSWEEYQDRKPTDEELRTWFGNGSQYNIGIITGEISDIVTVDLDGHEAIKFASENDFPQTPRTILDKVINETFLSILNRVYYRIFLLKNKGG